MSSKSPGGGWGISLAEMRSLTDEEVIKHFDAEAGNTFSIGQQYWWQEIVRRDNQHQADRIEDLTIQMRDMTRTIQRLTWWIADMTGVTVIATIITLVVTIVS